MKFFKNKIERFIKWMNYNPPFAATAQEWYDFDKEYKRRAPIRYFISNTLYLRVWSRIEAKSSRAKWWLIHRFVNKHKYHLINTKLSPGYHEVDVRMLHGSFSLLVEYLEEAKACQVSDEDAKTIRDKVLYYLSCKMEEEDEICGFDYAHAASEMKDLYIWWTETRPMREEPDFGDDEIPEEEDFVFYSLTEEFQEKYPEVYEKRSEYGNKIFELEEKWKKEDDEYLMRLVKIRGWLC